MITHFRSSSVMFTSYGLLEKDITFTIQPVPFTSILRPKNPAEMVYEGLDDDVINLNGLYHEVSGGVCQWNLMASVLFFVLTSLYVKKWWNKSTEGVVLSILIWQALDHGITSKVHLPDEAYISTAFANFMSSHTWLDQCECPPLFPEHQFLSKFPVAPIC